MKIKIKVKYLLLMALIIIASSAYLVPKAIYARAEALETVDMEASKVLYKRYISLVPFSTKKADAMFKIANQIAPHDDVLSMYELTQFGSSTSGKTLTLEIVNNAREYYEEIFTHYPDNPSYVKSYKRLIDIHIALGEHDKSKTLIETGLKSTNKQMSFIAQKYNMFYLMLEKKYDEAISLGQKLLTEKDDYYIGDVYAILADIYSSQMNFQKAVENYEKQNKERENILNSSLTKSKNYGDFTVYNLETKNFVGAGQLCSFNEMIDIYKESGDIHGKVIINGRPLAYAQLYLRDSRFIGLNTFSSGEKGYPFWTDEGGNYSIPKLSKGEYNIEVDIPLILLAKNRTVYQDNIGINKIIELSENESKEMNFTFVHPMNISPKGITHPEDNKVNIKWEKVDGAAYYYVNLTTMEDPINLVGSSGTAPVNEKITGTTYTLRTDGVNNQSRSYNINENGLVNIQAYLGVFSPGLKVPFSVTAYDKRNNIISSSWAIQEKYENLNIISSPQVEILEGDKLLTQKKPEEALKSYENYLVSNPNDVHVIDVLTRMYKIGIRYDMKNTGEYLGKDIYKSMNLANRSYKLTGDIEAVKYVLNSIYRDVNTTKDYKWALQQILNLPKEEIKKEQYLDLADINLRLKDFNSAKENFKTARNLGLDYLYDYPLLELYLEDFDESLKLSQNISGFLYNGNKSNFIQALKEIKHVDKTSEDYKAFREILGSVLCREKDYKKKYKDNISKIKNSTLNKMMIEISKDYNL